MALVRYQGMCHGTVQLSGNVPWHCSAIRECAVTHDITQISECAMTHYVRECTFAHYITQMSGNVSWHMILLRCQGMYHGT